MGIQALNLAQRLALLDDGATVPITDLFDANGEDTEDLAEAVGFAAGQDRHWFSGRISDYEGVPTQ